VEAIQKFGDSLNIYRHFHSGEEETVVGKDFESLDLRRLNPAGHTRGLPIHT